MRRGKTVTARPRYRITCSLTSNLLSRVQSWVAPPSFSGLSLNLMARLSASTARRTEICLGWPTISGCRHLPGSIRVPAAADHGLAVVGTDGAMILCGVSLHQVSQWRTAFEPRRSWRKEIRRLYDIGVSPRLSGTPPARFGFSGRRRHRWRGIVSCDHSSR